MLLRMLQVVILCFLSSSALGAAYCFDLFKLPKYEIYESLKQAGIFYPDYRTFSRVIEMQKQIEAKMDMTMEYETRHFAARVVGHVPSVIEFVNALYRELPGSYEDKNISAGLMFRNLALRGFVGPRILKLKEMTGDNPSIALQWLSENNVFLQSIFLDTLN